MHSTDKGEAAIQRLEAISQDYSETPRRVLFVLGSGGGVVADIFRKLMDLPHSSIDSAQLEELAAGTRRSLILSTPMQMVPEIVRSLSQINMAIYQVQLLEDSPDPSMGC
ncbi:MAG: hypothetical protein ACNA8O_08355 [Cyanobacteriota bacterium]|jgi:hypothetical protein